MSFRSQGMVRFMLGTIASAFASLPREQKRQVITGGMTAYEMGQRGLLRNSRMRSGGNNKGQHRKMVARRTRNRLAKLSRRINRHG